MGIEIIQDFFTLKAALENKRTSIIDNLEEKYKGKLEHSKKLSKQYFASVRRDSFAEDNLINDSHRKRVLNADPSTSEKDKNMNSQVIAGR